MIYQIQWQRRGALKESDDLYQNSIDINPLISTMVSMVSMGTQSTYKMNIWY